MDIIFANPWMFSLLAFVGLLSLLFLVPTIRRKRKATFQLPQTFQISELTDTLKTKARHLPTLLVFAALSLMVAALARPQADEGRTVSVEGIDIFLALDMSGSMKAVDMSRSELEQKLDANEKPDNRFDSAVGVLKDFIRSRENDRIGMTIFAKDAFLQFPLTLDYNTVLAMLDRLSLGDIDSNGTAIGNAIGRAVAGLRQSDAESRILILITDGERQGGNIAPMKAAKIAKEYDIKIFPILVGKKGATYVPVDVHSLFGDQDTQFKKQKFPVNPELLKNIADTTGGTYYRASDAEGLKNDLHNILDKFEKTRIEDTANIDRSERYHPFVYGAVLLLFIQGILRYTVLRRYP